MPTATFETPSVIEGFSGFAFIGDTHIASRRPGRRLDDYAAACLDKLSQIAKICRERNLYPVHLGDLFHRASENNVELLSSIMDVLREFPVPVPVLAGSHDRTETHFTGKDSAQLLKQAGVVRLLEKPGKALTLRIAGELVSIWAAPAGIPLPTALDGADGGVNIVISHHDLDFTGPYPGSAPLHEIEGCSMLVNGHMHTPTRPVIHGQTVCHNPGSTMRVSVDQRDYRPGVSVWEPSCGRSLERVELKFAPNVFDLTGKEVYAADSDAVKESLAAVPSISSFAAKLRAQGATAMDAKRTQDGTALLEEIEAYIKASGESQVLKKTLVGLMQEVVEA